MDDFEISKALALAIGWDASDMIANHEGKLICYNGPSLAGVFNYKDWNVIGPIAERFDAFPFETQSGWESWMANTLMSYSDTPQKAIALAVIGAKK